MKGPVAKVCEACGVTFSCEGYQCWCGKLEITERQMDWIAQRYQDCLCRACLIKVRTSVQGPETSATDR